MTTTLRMKIAEIRGFDGNNLREPKSVIIGLVSRVEKEAKKQGCTVITSFQESTGGAWNITQRSGLSLYARNAIMLLRSSQDLSNGILYRMTPSNLRLNSPKIVIQRRGKKVQHLLHGKLINVSQ